MEVYDWEGGHVAKMEHFTGTTDVCCTREFIAIDVSTEYGVKDEISGTKGIYYFIEYSRNESWCIC